MTVLHPNLIVTYRRWLLTLQRCQTTLLCVLSLGFTYVVPVSDNTFPGFSGSRYSSSSFEAPRETHPEKGWKHLIPRFCKIMSGTEKAQPLCTLLEPSLPSVAEEGGPSARWSETLDSLTQAGATSPPSPALDQPHDSHMTSATNLTGMWIFLTSRLSLNRPLTALPATWVGRGEF